MDFNPQGGEVFTAPEGGGINYKAAFTGIVDATPLAFNPTKQQIIEIKDIPPARQAKEREPKYLGVYKDFKDKSPQTKLELLMKIHPNELLCDKDEDGNVIKKEYVDDKYISLDFAISDKDEISKSGKHRFINQSLQSTWADNLDVIKSNTKMDWFDTETARPAKIGEVLLYNLLYAMFKLSGTKENPITGFKLGEDPTETFCDIVNGDMTPLNDLLDPESKSFKFFSHEDGRSRKIAIMLGVRESEATDSEGNPYYNQEVFTNQYVNNCFGKEGRDLSKDAKESLLGEGFRAATQESTQFQVYDPIKAAQAAIDAMANVEETSVDTEEMEADLESEDFGAAFGDGDFG